MSSYRGVALALLVAAMVAGCSSSDSSEPSAEQAKPDGPAMAGTYRFDFDVAKRTALGQPAPRTEPLNAKWAFRSNCADSGCIATATKLNNDGSASTTSTTLDLLDGNWVMVLGEDSNCNAGGQPARVLGTWVLAPQPDDTLTGMWTEITTGNDCPWVLQMPVKVTREGDTPEGVEVADPTTVPPRKPSKADGFHGSYTQTITVRPPDVGDPGIVAVKVATYCVRNTDECASTQGATIANVPQITPLTISGDRGTNKFNRRAGQCPDGAPEQSVGYDEVLLPDPSPNPIPRLTGTRRLEFTGPCPRQQVLDLLYERDQAPPAPGPGNGSPSPAPPPPPAPAPTPGG